MTKKRRFDDMSNDDEHQEPNFQKKNDTDLWAQAYLKIMESFKTEYSHSYEHAT